MGGKPVSEARDGLAKIQGSVPLLLVGAMARCHHLTPREGSSMVMDRRKESILAAWPCSGDSS